VSWQITNRMRPERWLHFFFAAFLLTAALALRCEAAGSPIVFKAVDFAILRVDERPAKTWDVYLAEKKRLILVRLGTRYLLLETEAREVYEVAPEAFEQRKDELVLKAGGDETRQRKLLPSEAWNIRDAGPSRNYKLRLTEEGRTIEVQLRIVPTWLRNAY